MEKNICKFSPYFACCSSPVKPLRQRRQTPEAPKLIVTGVAVPGGELAAGESAGITVTMKKI